MLALVTVSKISTGCQIVLEHTRDIMKTVPEKLGARAIHQKFFAFLLKMRKLERKNWRNMMVFKQRDRDLQDIGRCLALKELVWDFIRALQDKDE